MEREENISSVQPVKHRLSKLFDVAQTNLDNNDIDKFITNVKDLLIILNKEYDAMTYMKRAVIEVRDILSNFNNKSIRGKINESKNIITEIDNACKHYLKYLKKTIEGLRILDIEHQNELKYFSQSKKIDNEIEELDSKFTDLMAEMTTINFDYSKHRPKVKDTKTVLIPFITEDQQNVFDYLNKNWVNPRPIKYAYIYRYMVDELNMKIDYTTYNKFIISKYGKKVQRNNANSDKTYDQIREIMTQYNQ